MTQSRFKLSRGRGRDPDASGGVVAPPQPRAPSPSVALCGGRRRPPPWSQRGAIVWPAAVTAGASTSRRRDTTANNPLQRLRRRRVGARWRTSGEWRDQAVEVIAAQTQRFSESAGSTTRRFSLPARRRGNVALVKVTRARRRAGRNADELGTRLAAVGRRSRPTATLSSSSPLQAGGGGSGHRRRP